VDVAQKSRTRGVGVRLSVAVCMLVAAHMWSNLVVDGSNSVCMIPKKHSRGAHLDVCGVCFRMEADQLSHS
jgi:hypothetical protein